MTTTGPTRSFQQFARDAPVYSFSVADPAASSSGGVIYTSMANETLPPVGQLVISVYAYVGIAFLIATFLFALGYAAFRIRRDRGKRNYELDNPFYDTNEDTRYISGNARLKKSELGKINFSLANEIRKKQAKEAKAGRKSTLDLPVLEPPQTVKRSGSNHGNISNPTKRVSWASSASTARNSQRPFSEPKPSTLPEESTVGSDTPARPSSVSISPLPRAQDSHTRVNVSHMSDPRALRSRELVGNTTPGLCQSWAKPDKAGNGMNNFLGAAGEESYR
ncbi:hypothetical protein D9756_000894 [Leucocoprinus leucothites]|uniref:Uncharacterized protein n=1 Tax=Leucocoprinus leucothites TaxID=201217 RepID=A0A8H5GGH2_9AGAR|nr:hypothetical protein D9756_000894 [Leucoagaricus leucothites]